MKMKDFNISMTQYNRGDIITGTIVMIGEKEVVVALGGLKEGVFPKTELDAPFKIGDAILVMVTGKVDDKGCLILNHSDVNKAIEDKEKLKNLKVGSELEFCVESLNNFGVLGSYMGYRVFMPFSQCSIDDFVNKESLKGRMINAIVIELDNIKKSIVCSSKLLEQTDITPIEIGQEIQGRIVKLEDKFAIAKLDNGSKAKLSIQDASYEHIDKMSDVVELGGTYNFRVLELNTDYSRIRIGIKQLAPNPADEIFDKIHVGDEVEGVVAKILPIGAIVKLNNGLTALALTKENTDKSFVATHHIYKLGANVKGYISNINKVEHKLNIITNKISQ